MHHSMLSKAFFTLLVLPAASAFVLATPVSQPTQLAQRQDGTITTDIPDAYPTDGSYFTSTKQIEVVAGTTNDHVTIPAKAITIAIPTCIPVIVPDENGHVPPGTCNAIWSYYPSFGAAVAFAIVFAIVTALHIAQAIQHKKAFCWVIVMACVWETLAYIFRAASARNQQSVGIYLIFQIFVLMAPLWVNAFVYMVFGRLIWYLSPTRSVLGIPATTISFIFVLLDVASFVVQLVGGSMAGPRSPVDEQLKAIHIYMGGIGMQQFFIVVFVGLAVKFQLELKREGQRTKGMARSVTWLMAAIYVSLAAISARIIYRLVEHNAGPRESNPLAKVEAYFYILEAVPMLVGIAVFNIVHPGSVLVGPDSNLPGVWQSMKEICGGRKQSPTGASRSYVEMSDLESVHSANEPLTREGPEKPRAH